jgi:tellurite resistance protein TerC
VFVGAKMMLTDIYKIPIAASLGVVAGILAVAVVASLVVTGREQHRDAGVTSADLRT